MDNPFAPWLRAGRTVILDGGLGTELERRGHRDLGRLWSSSLVRSHPAALSEVHRDFLDAGADVIATATFQASVPTLLECGLDRRSAEELLRTAVRLAVEERNAAASRAGRAARPLVAASIGPFGAHLADGSEYTGCYSASDDDLRRFQRDRWHILAETEADIIACETFPSLADVRSAIRLMQETPHRWAWISLVCRDAGHLADGTDLKLAVDLLNDVPNLAAIGANCIAPSLAPAVISSLRDLTSLPVMMYPNASNSWDMETRTSRDHLDAEAFARAAEGWKGRGAQIIGGCCRTTAEHVRQLARSLAA